ncbi:hypothetical protein ACE6H2_010276 [Prunus campanulata]
MDDTALLDAYNDSQMPLRSTHTSIRNTQIDNWEEDDVPRNVEGIVNEAADDHKDDSSIVCNGRARGLNRPNWATESIEVVEFNARGQAIAPKKKTVARWQRFLGLMAVDQEERWNCTDDRVSKEQWRLLVKYWETGPAQKVNHRGISPDRCKMFELCHLRKNGTPVNKTAAKAMEDMNSKIIDIRDKKKQNQLPDEVTAEEINIVYAEVLGREKGNRLRGCGIGVRTEDVLGVLRGKRGLRLEFDDMRESYEERIVQVTKDANEREERIKREMREEGRATTEKVKHLEQLLMKQQAIMEKVLASASNVSNIDFELLLGHVSSSTLQVALGNRLEEIMTATIHSPTCQAKH